MRSGLNKTYLSSLDVSLPVISYNKPQEEKTANSTIYEKILNMELAMLGNVRPKVEATFISTRT